MKQSDTQRDLLEQILARLSAEPQQDFAQQALAGINESLVAIQMELDGVCGVSPHG